jgi:nucleoid-associated protein YgaU
MDSAMRRMALSGLGGAILLLLVALLFWPGAEAPEPAAPGPAPAAQAPQARPAPEAREGAHPGPAGPPRFDVVRVGARGGAVIAGRASPGAEVVLLLDGTRELGRARADARGEWVILPAETLPPGAWDLSLRARLAGEETAGPDTVVVVVPEPGAALAARGAAPAHAPPPADAAPPAPAAAAATEGAPIAVLIPSASQGTPPRILQGPQPPPATGAAGRGGPPARLGMDSVDYQDGGGIRFAGTAPPGAAVRVYVGEEHAGDAVADAAGRWMLAPGRQPPVGRHALRVDQLAAGGSVAARVEVPFQRDEMPPEAFGNRAVVVQPGANLWRIARSTYGQGVHYAVIYQANREQIRDPNRIFPGQIFALPEGTSAPSASSASR